MFFFKNIFRNYHFLKGLCLAEGLPDWFDANRFWPNIDWKEKNDTHLPPEEQNRIDELQELRDELATISSSQKFVSKHENNLKNALLKIYNWEEEWMSSEDPEFQQLAEKVQRLHDELQSLIVEWKDIDLALKLKMWEIREEAGKKINKIRSTSEWTSAKEYSQEDISRLSEEKSEITTQIRKDIYSFIWESDSWEKLSSLMQHEKIQWLLKEDNEGIVYGYNLEPLFIRFDSIFSVEDASQWDTQKTGMDLDYQIHNLISIQKELTRTLRDISLVGEWDKSLSEVREDSSNIAYDTFLENATPEQKDLVNRTIDGKEISTDFEDLTVAQILEIQKTWYDIKRLIFVWEDGKPFPGWRLKEGESYIVNFWNNTELDSVLKMVHIDHSLWKIDVDWVLAEYQTDHPKGPWYYTIDEVPVDITDGSLVKILSESNGLQNERITFNDAIVSNLKKRYIEDSIGREAFDRAVRADPNASFDSSSFPWWLIGKLMALIAQVLSWTEYTFNKETGRYESESGEVLTNREFSEWYISSNNSLGSLSAKFESGDNGPLAYNPDDNGHGPSYWSYQMNTNKWVYRAFIAKHNMAEWREAWNAKVHEVGKKEFAKMEHQFIKEQNYDPMMSRITLPGKEKMSLALKNVIWSSAVQHWPGRKSLLEVINSFESNFEAGNKKSEQQLINAIYDERGRLYPAGIESRYNEERQQALNMLDMVPSGEMYDIEFSDKMLESFVSAPAYERRNKATGKVEMTYCSQTARENMQKLWIPNVKRGWSAKESYYLYPAEMRSPEFPPVSSTAKVADLYLDASPKNREHGHRVTAIKKWNAWYVCDPYYTIPGIWKTQQPIPAEKYLAHMKWTKGRKVWGAVYFGSKTS